MATLPEPSLLLDILRDRQQMALEVESGNLSKSAKARHIRHDLTHQKQLGNEVYQRVSDLGSFAEEEQRVGGPLYNAMVSIGLAVELQMRRRFHSSYESHCNEIYDGGFLGQIDPSAVKWPRPVVNELLQYQLVDKWYVDLLHLANTVAIPVDDAVEDAA